MDRECDQALILEMDPAREVIDHRLGGTVRGNGKWDMLHRPDAGGHGADDNEFRLGRLLQKGPEGLE